MPEVTGIVLCLCIKQAVRTQFAISRFTVIQCLGYTCVMPVSLCKVVTANRVIKLLGVVAASFA